MRKITALSASEKPKLADAGFSGGAVHVIAPLATASIVLIAQIKLCLRG
jgi:hypothetical protein